MTGKIQIALLTVVMLLGGSGFHRAIGSLSQNSHFLYALAQYKMVTGDTESAVKLFRQATEASSKPAPAPSAQPSHSSCGIHVGMEG